MTGPRSLHVISSLNPASGGPTQSVGLLCEALNSLGAPAEIATVLGPEESCAEFGSTPVHTFPMGFPRKLRPSPALGGFLLREAPRFDLIHVHGLWEWPGVLARRAAQRHGKPLVISPRGMLEPWSLRQRALLKRVALATWEGSNLRAASLLHATAPSEASNLVSFGLPTPVAVIPNGLVFPPQSPNLRPGPPTALCLARFHPVKGGELLLKAWAEAGNLGNWRLLFAGPDENGFRATLEALAKHLGLEASVQFSGPVFGQDKWNLLRQSQLLILPSQNESFGNVVPEALSQGLPVIATEGTPWQELQTRRCGWWVPGQVDALAEVLGQVAALPADALSEMGERGRAWALSAFSAQAAATAMRRAYVEVCRAPGLDPADSRPQGHTGVPFP